MKARSKSYVNAFAASAAGIGLLWFLLGAFQAAQRAAEQDRHRQELYANKLSEEWIRREIESLASGRTSGVYFYSTVNTDALVEQLARMPEVNRLTFEKTDLSDSGMESIATLPNLEKLTIHGGAVGSAGLEILRQVDKLQTLHMIDLDLTDDGLVALQTLKNLKSLTVYCDKHSNNKLTDAAIQHLGELKQLRKLNIGGGWLSVNALNELKSVLNGCTITENYADDEW